MKGKSILKMFITAILVGTCTLAAQEARIKITVYPPEAQIFLDAKSWGKGPAKLIKTMPGTHMIIVANYGFASLTHEVTLNEGDNSELKFTLVRSGGPVSGPWGTIQLENAPNEAAVLLNGKTPDYLVGHVDMFNNHNGWRQQLLVRPGKHLVTILSRDGEIWSGEVEVRENARVIVNVGRGTSLANDWSDGANHPVHPRFSAGIASATVAVAPVGATFTAEPNRVNCGGTTRLAWSTQDAIDTSIRANSVSLGALPVSGERTEQPRQTTTYEFKATGPGGVATSTATTEVNTVAQADLEASPVEVRYHRMGDRIVEQTPAKLNWTSSNADSVSIDPIGMVGTSGNQELRPTPKQNTNGAVDEKVIYTLTANNICGGSQTQTAMIHITGTIEPTPEVPLASVFFPTAYPGHKNAEVGLVRSQHNVLGKTAEGLKKYLLYEPSARLTLVAHADERGPAAKNLSLSERRANRVKACLVKQGVPEDRIDILALGETQNLSRADVIALHNNNPNKPSFAKRYSQVLQWAYNRRVDITLTPNGQNSTQFFPGDAEEAKLLFRSEYQSRRAVQKAGEVGALPPAGTQ